MWMRHKLSIRGINQYVWTFTGWGINVIFRLTETRESDIVHEILHGYDGVPNFRFFMVVMMLCPANSKNVGCI